MRDARQVYDDHWASICAGDMDRVLADYADDAAFKTLRSVKVPDALEVEPRAPGSAVRLSGAAALMSPWRVRRAVRAEAGGP